METSCYVSMPFGTMKDSAGNDINFDQVYQNFIRPTVLECGLSCERGDSNLGAVIHKGVLRLVLQSDLMISDITMVNPNVIYELGIRFATHPTRTILVNGLRGQLPFHLSVLPRIHYQLDDLPSGREALKTAILSALQNNTVTSPIFEFFPHMNVHLPRDPCVFIGHGHSVLWLQVKEFLENRLKLRTISYESEPQAGLTIVQVLESMLKRASFALLVMTAEDVMGSQQLRARQNVVHEAGLFQGSLGFPRAIVLRQDNVEEFSNIEGLQHIAFSGDQINQTFHELERVLKREGLHK